LTSVLVRRRQLIDEVVPKLAKGIEASHRSGGRHCLARSALPACRVSLGTSPHRPQRLSNAIIAIDDASEPVARIDP
jgi:hypothetical protein